MDIRHVRKQGQTGPSGLSSAWNWDRNRQGAIRIRPRYLSWARWVGAGYLVYGVFSTRGHTAGGHRTPADMLIAFTVLLLPVLMLWTWTEEWLVSPGKVEARNGPLGLLSKRCFLNGTFTLGTPRPASFSPWTLLWVPVGILMLCLGTCLVFGDMDGLPAAFGLANLTIDRASLLGGALVLGGVAVVFIPGMSWSSSHSAADTRGTCLLLRSGTEELTLPGSESPEVTAELVNMAAWLSTQTGWPLAASTSGSTAGVLEAPHDAVPAPPAKAVVEPFLPADWEVEPQPDGSLRVVPGFTTGWRTHALVLGATGLVAIFGSLWLAEISALIGLALIAVLEALRLLNVGEAWVVGKDRFEVHRRCFFIWRRRRYEHGQITVQPKAKASTFRFDILPIIGLVAWMASYPLLGKLVLDPLGERGPSHENIASAIFIAWILAPWVAIYLYLYVIARAARIEATSKLYVRATAPGRTEPDTVDLLANNIGTRFRSEWEPGLGELRTVADWLSFHTGWPVTETD